MTDPTLPGPPGREGQQQPPSPPPGYQHPPPSPGPEPGSGRPPGSTYPGGSHGPLDLARLVFVAAWVVLVLYGLWFIYTLASDDRRGFDDRLFGSLPQLAQGLLTAGVLLAISVWLGKQRANG